MKNITGWLVIGFVFGAGFHFADQLIWYIFDIMKILINHPLG